MPVISEFIFNLANPDFDTLAPRTGDLVIIETGSDSRFGQTLTTTQVAALQDQGRTVIGYLNVAVTDHARLYWEPDPGDDWVAEIDPGNPDVGPVNPGAPDWLVNNHGFATDGGTTTFGYIVDYTDPDWQARVIAEAVHLVTPVAQGGLGYDGVFLDDVGRYFDAAENDTSYDPQQAARDMIDFVNAIAAAVRAVSPDAYIAINGGAYIGWDSGEPTSADTLAFFDNVDALLLENQFGEAWVDVLNNATHWAGGQDFLAIEHSGHSIPADFAAWARDNGVVPYVVADDDYDDVPPITPGQGSAGPDLITGGDGPNWLDGLDGNDRITGLGGDDELFGRKGSDTLTGGNGADTLLGGFGADELFGNNGQDWLDGGPNNDRLFGSNSNDTVIGGNGRDTAYLGNGDDRFIDNGQIGIRGSDRVFGGNGNDLIEGRGGYDTIFGGNGNDTLFGGWDYDVIDGGNGNDQIMGGAGFDRIYAGDHDDVVEGGHGRDWVYLGNGNDHFVDDSQTGRRKGSDRVFGGPGNDTIEAEGGNDTLTGGPGADTFVFTGSMIEADRVTDYTPGTDALQIDDALWGGGLTAAQVVNTYAQVTPDGVLFDFGGGNSILLAGLSTTNGLADDLTIF
ncbi:MAG: endo alpha-1,4 polygalactosaminidase [Paracoccaceae bacterium]|nr:endo alpha-1,4 polygalactosaminidase [Paracoccaceae bacterium]